MPANRGDELREHERLRLEPMYSSVTVQWIDRLSLKALEGHAYDISLGGARIELDTPIAVGERIAMCLRLPGDGSSIFVSGQVVWAHDDEDDPGPHRMAVQFNRFLNADDRDRLVRYLGVHAGRTAA